MLVERFNALQTRLRELEEREPGSASWLDKARALFVSDQGAGDLEPIHALTRELDAIGIYTTADVRLLRELSAHRQSLQTLAEGLQQRAQESLECMTLALASAERAHLKGSLASAELRELQQAFLKLGRIVKTAAIFGGSAHEGQLEVLKRVVSVENGRPASMRLAVVEYLADRANKTIDDVPARKRDLELAHELLLQMGADAGKERQRVHDARLKVAALRGSLRHVPPVRSLDELVRHVRFAAREHPSEAWHSLRSLYDRAIGANDLALAQVANQALTAALPPTDRLSGALERDQLMRVVPEGALPEGGKRGIDDLTADALAELAMNLDSDQQKALELAAGCNRFFDIEESLIEDSVESVVAQQKPRWRRVSHPTETMTYDTTNSLDDLENFVIAHPKMILHDLASNRQVVRSYLERVDPVQKKHKQQTAVRVYVLDASGSMFGERAQFRDAILIGELNGLRVRAKLGIPFDPLYFSFFNDVPTDLARVDSAQTATHYITKLFANSPAEGQTDITLALISAFDSIRAARGRDPYLARATVVLVTDGEDGVDLELIRKLRKPLKDVDISLSFISLGDENVTLRQLVNDQRVDGSRAFYHHVSDAEIKLAPTSFDSTRKTLLPDHLEVTPESLEKLLPHLEALDALARTRATTEATSAVEQFEVFFSPTSKPGKKVSPHRDQVIDMLNAIADAASLAPVESRTREAVTLLNHLLQLYEVTVPRYLEAVASDDPEMVRARERVRLLCKPWS